MRVSVALNALLGIALSVLYIVSIGYIWRFRKHWLIVVPVVNAVVYAIPTAFYIERAFRGDVDVMPLNWGALLIILPAVQIGMFLYWATRDAARGKAIASQAQVFTDEAIVRAEERAEEEAIVTAQVAADKLEAAAERTERADHAAERTADATERLADSAEGLVPKPDE